MLQNKKITKKILLILLLQILFVTTNIVFNNNTIKASAIEPTADETIYISTEAELKNFATAVNGGNTYSGKTVKLKNDITLSCTSTNQWTPIGKSNIENGNLAHTDTNKKAFAGTFDGQGFTISKVYIDSSSQNYVGLFGYNEGTIKNLKLKDSTIKSNKSYVGGIVGYNCGTIINCHNYATVTSNSNEGASGGVVAYSIKNPTNNVEILDCSNKGKISGKNGYIAGVVGYARGTTITNCYNVGEIENTEYAVSGICGLSINSNINNCYNKGAIKSTNFIGTIAAQLLGNSNIKNSYNLGNISNNSSTDKKYIGGIAGYINLDNQNSNKIINCYSVSKITASGAGANDSIGYIVGEITSATTDNCYYEINGSTGLTKDVGKKGTSATTTNIVKLNANKTKEKATITKLNKGQTAYYYDDQVINNGYPILDNQYRVLIKKPKVILIDGTRYIKEIKPVQKLNEALTKEKLETQSNIKVDNLKIESITDKNTTIKTNMKLTAYLNDEEVEYTVVVTGDLFGDGEMDDADLLKLARYMAGLDTELGGAFLIATDINEDNKQAELSDLHKMINILVELDEF